MNVNLLTIVDPSSFVVRQNRSHMTPKWWACPTTLSRRGERLVGTPGGLEAYGVWCLLVGFMAQARYRWTLADSDGKPIPLEDLAWKWRVSESSLTAAVERLVSIGWLAWQDDYEAPSSESGTPPAQHGRDETDGRDVTVRNDSESWLRHVVGLGLSRASVEAFRALSETHPAAPAAIERALSDGISRKRAGKIKSVEGWASGVRRNIATEVLR